MPLAMPTELISLILLFVGILASFINVIAGGGSVLSLGSMMLLGIDPQVANGTNRVALVAESASAIWVYRKKLKNDIRKSFSLSLWTLPGALLGAFFAIEIPDDWFRWILIAVILLVLVTVLFPFHYKETSNPRNTESWLFRLSMLLIGFYGGFIQAGIGFVIMVSFHLLAGMKLLEINIHKVYIVLIYTLPVLGIFIWSGNIHWLFALALGLGHVIGAWIAATISITRGEQLIREVVALAMLIMAVKLALTGD